MPSFENLTEPPHVCYKSLAYFPMSLEWLHKSKEDQQQEEQLKESLKQVRIAHAYQAMGVLPTYKKILIERHVKPIQADMSEQLHRGKGDVQEAIIEATSQQQLPPGTALYRQVSRAFVEQFHTAFLQKAAVSMQTAPAEFDLFFDAAYGVKFAMNGLAKVDEPMTSRPTLNIQGSPVYVVPGFYAAKDMLGRDPSGFRLIERSILQLETARDIPHATMRPHLEGIEWFNEPDYVAAGADVGATLYRELYTLAQETFPTETPIF
jgi:hypothetical protein